MALCLEHHDYYNLKLPCVLLLLWSASLQTVRKPYKGWVTSALLTTASPVVAKVLSTWKQSLNAVKREERAVLGSHPSLKQVYREDFYSNREQTHVVIYCKEINN